MADTENKKGLTGVVVDYTAVSEPRLPGRADLPSQGFDTQMFTQFSSPAASPFGPHTIWNSPRPAHQSAP